MDSHYLAYFGQRMRLLTTETLGEVYTGSPAWRTESMSDRPAHFIASGAVSQAQRALGQVAELRPDAQLLLYLLASELVAKPVLTMNPNAAREVAATLVTDAVGLVGSAAELADSDPDRGAEVSAHAVIDALSSNWSRLGTASWRVWDSRRTD